MLTLLSWGLNFASLWVKMVFYRLETMSLMLKSFPWWIQKSFWRRHFKIFTKTYLNILKNYLFFRELFKQWKKNATIPAPSCTCTHTQVPHMRLQTAKQKEENQLCLCRQVPGLRGMEIKYSRLGAYFICIWIFRRCVMTHWLFLWRYSTKGTAFGLNK